MVRRAPPGGSVWGGGGGGVGVAGAAVVDAMVVFQLQGVCCRWVDGWRDGLREGNPSNDRGAYMHQDGGVDGQL